MKRVLFSAFLVIALLLASMVPALASPGIGNSEPAETPGITRTDDRPDPFTEDLKERKAFAMQAKLHGKAYGHTYAVARGQYVELEREGEGAVWTVLGEFADMSHNAIAEPDRSVDNTTIWVPDFSREHFMDLLFSMEPGEVSMRQFYIEQSSNRYTVYGDVTEWIPVPGEAASYDDDLGGPAVWQFLVETTDGWYDSQTAAGMSAEAVNEFLSQFDKWDRYDYDGDGDFDEPDGYIDTFQSVHAGEGNEAGGGVLGDDAIWSHSWYAYSNRQGPDGPGPDFNPQGGVRIGESDYWVGKYTIQPENGGVGVFAHEFGHDLGLPDLYDTSGGENGTGFWTLMSSGSWMGSGQDDIGSKPDHMGVWEKLQLGWLNYELAYAGEKSQHKLGPSTANTKQAQGLIVVLPQKEVEESIGSPYEGEYYYYSGSGDDLDNFMYKPFTLADGSSLTAMVKYNIESDWDYAYLVVSTDGGATWESVNTSRSTTADPNGQNFGYGITGRARNWTQLTADLSAYSGEVLLGFRYWTDGNTGGFGFMVDNLEISGYEMDGAETDAGWTFEGFRATTGTEIRLYDNYYVAEYRQYRGYDDTLLVGPYNFGFLDNPELGNWVEHFPYQDGLLIHYWDTSQSNNQVGRHPGQGLVLPIDAHPQAMYRADGGVWRNRIQTYDSTFGFEATDAITLHWLSQESFHPSLPAEPVFDDNNSYYDPANPMGSVITPVTGTQIRIKSISARGGFMQVEVRPSK